MNITKTKEQLICDLYAKFEYKQIPNITKTKAIKHQTLKKQRQLNTKHNKKEEDRETEDDDGCRNLVEKESKKPQLVCIFTSYIVNELPYFFFLIFYKPSTIDFYFILH